MRRSAEFIAVMTGILAIALFPAVSAGADTPANTQSSSLPPPGERGFLPPKPFSVGFRLAGTYTLPFETDNTHVKSGIGFDADIVIPLKPTFSLRLNVGKSGLRVDDDKIAASGSASAPLPPWIRLIGGHEKMTAVRYSAAAQYNNMPRGFWGNNILVYLYGGLEITVHDIEYGYTSVNDSTGEEFPYAMESTDPGIGPVFGVGMTYFVSDWIGIDLSGRAGLMWAHEDLTTDSYSAANNLILYDGTFDIKTGIFLIF